MKTFLLFLLILAAGNGYAQQDPLYAQYLLNPLLVNPAYAGIDNNLKFTSGYRMQWAGFDGQPNTFNISAHSSFAGNKVGAGILVITDKVGNTTNTEISVPVSYKLALATGSLSFGMQAGYQSFSVNNNQLNIYDPGDVVFGTGERGTKLNIGAGMMFRNDDWVVGISVPRLMPSTFDAGGEELELYNQHFYLFTSWLYRFSPDVWIKPSIMARGVKNAPASVDVSASGIFYDRYMAGIFTRSFNTYGLQLQSVIGDKFFFGYVFELPTNKSVGTRFTAHEVSVGLRLSVLPFHDRIARNF